MNNSIISNTGGSGGGIECRLSSPVISNNKIRHNEARVGGGGILSRQSSPSIIGNIVSENTSIVWIGGISLISGDLTVTGNRILNNKGSDGGGMGISSLTSGTIDNNIISGNRAYQDGGTHGSGGGIYCNGSTVTLFNNIINNNSAKEEGGGIYCYESDITLINNTIFKNESLLIGGGIHCRESSADIVNSILSDDTAPLGSEVALEGTSHITIGYSNLRGGHASIFRDTNSTVTFEAGMIDADPLFVDPLNGDCHLTVDSPCVNAGAKMVPNLPPEDFEGDSRIVDGQTDMGGDELHTHLYLVGEAIPGGQLLIRVIGPPNASPVWLAMSTGIHSPPVNTPYGDLHLLVQTAALRNIGSIGANGVLSHITTVPQYWNPGEKYFFQALVGLIGSPSSELSNLMTVVVE